MLKMSIAFLAGVLAMAVDLYVSGARFALPMFFAGVVVVLAPLVALLSSVKRIRAVARFLSAFAHAWEKRIGPDSQAAIVDTVADDVASALVNQGTPRKVAAAVAAAAAKTNREFDPAFRAALKLLPKVA
jgi:hypothetical protein